MSGRGALLHGELACAGCALALLVAMTALGWFGVDGTPTPAHPGPHAVDAWNGLPVLSWFLAATAVLGLVSPTLRITGRPVRAELAPVVAVAGSATFLALAFRILVNLPDPPAIVDQKLGALVGLACAGGLAVSAWTAVAGARVARVAAAARAAETAGTAGAAGAVRAAGPGDGVTSRERRPRRTAVRRTA